MMDSSLKARVYLQKSIVFIIFSLQFERVEVQINIVTRQNRD